MSEPILIWGAGAIGGTLGAYWRAPASTCCSSTRLPSMSRRSPDDGPRDRRAGRELHAGIAAATPDEVEGVYRRVVLAVKAQHTEAALERWRRILPPTASCSRPRTG